MSSERSRILYSDKYQDKVYEYRHVTLPTELGKLAPRNHTMNETEWRNIGIQMSRGWMNFMIHEPEPHVILFRRKLETRSEPDTEYSSETSSENSNEN